MTRYFFTILRLNEGQVFPVHDAACVRIVNWELRSPNIIANDLESFKSFR